MTLWLLEDDELAWSPLISLFFPSWPYLTRKGRDGKGDRV